MAGKLGGQVSVNAICPGSLLFVTDLSSGVKFLVDSGASVSMLPGPTSSSSSAPRLKTANGARIATGAERRLNLRFMSSTASPFTFTWNFLYGTVDGPILGNDFLKANSLSVDPAAACMRLPSGVFFSGEMAFSLGSMAAVLPSDIASLLQEFPAVAASGSMLLPAVHEVQHHLETTGPPV